MKLQVLVASLNQDVSALAERMRLAGEAIIVNQCDRYGYEELDLQGRKVQCFHMAERGVGLSRNTALMRARAQLVLFSDEDIVYEDGYEEKVVQAFAEHPDADIITFQFEVDERRRTYENRKEKRIRWYNYGRYPAYAIGARRESLLRSGITYSLLFGGGARYGNGEDNLFLHDALKKGLKIIAVPVCLGREEYRESTWFKGYTRKFFFDRGVLYAYLYGPMAKVFGLRFLLVKGKVMCTEVSVKQAYRWLLEGVREGKLGGDCPR